MHIAFPGFEEERRYRLDASTERNPPNRQEEYLCDLGAAALLMPRDLVRGGSIRGTGSKRSSDSPRRPM